jgi:hypothetical protein
MKMPPLATEPFDVNTLAPDETAPAETLHSFDDLRNRDIFAPKGRRPGPNGDRQSPQPAHTNNSNLVHPTHTPDAPTVAEDSINPAHYRKHPSGIECIEVTRHMNFNTGNAVKYIWRYMDKGDPIENLKKAQWYIDDEIRRLQGIR